MYIAIIFVSSDSVLLVLALPIVTLAILDTSDAIVANTECRYKSGFLFGDDSDYTASCCACVHNGNIYLGKPILFRKSFPDTVTEMMSVRMGEEIPRHGTGKSLHETAAVQSLIMKGFYFEQIDEKGDKITRA